MAICDKKNLLTIFIAFKLEYFSFYLKELKFGCAMETEKLLPVKLCYYYRFFLLFK